MKSQTANIVMLYLVIFFGLGTFFPYLSVYLQESLKYSGSQIGLLYAVSSLIVVISVPLFGIIADKIRSPKKMIIVAALLALIFFIPFSIVKQFYLVAILYTLIHGARSALMPLIDTVAMDHCFENKLNFGYFRAASSASFIVASVLIGFLLNEFPEYTKLFIYAQMLMLVLTIYFTLFLNNNYARHEASNNFLSDIKALLKSKRFILVILIMGMSYAVVQVAQSYISLSIIDLGGREDVVGLVFFFLVLPEVIFMSIVLKWLKRISHMQLMLIGAILLLLRWIILIFTNSIPILLIVSMAHGFVIAFIILIGMDLLRLIVKPHLLSTAISVYVGLSNVFFAIISFLCGLVLNDNIKDTYYIYLVATILVIIGIVIYMRKESLSKKTL